MLWFEPTELVRCSLLLERRQLEVSDVQPQHSEGDACCVCAQTCPECFETLTVMKQRGKKNAARYGGFAATLKSCAGRHRYSATRGQVFPTLSDQCSCCYSPMSNGRRVSWHASEHCHLAQSLNTGHGRRTLWCPTISPTYRKKYFNQGSPNSEVQQGQHVSGTRFAQHGLNPWIKNVTRVAGDSSCSSLETVSCAASVLSVWERAKPGERGL